MWWWARPDGFLQLLPSSRFTKSLELLAPYQVNTPLWAAHTIVVDPKIPRTDEATGTEDAHPFVSVVGAAWLLMSQTNITETRQTEPTNSPEGTDPVNPGAREPSSVTIVSYAASWCSSAARRRGSLAGPADGHTRRTKVSIAAVHEQNGRCPKCRQRHLHGIPNCDNRFGPIKPDNRTHDFLVDDTSPRRRLGDELQLLGVLDGVVDEDDGALGLVDH